MTEAISVLLVDDHALVRRGFKRLLEDDPGICVVGEASDGDEAVLLAGSLQPTVVVMDCAMPGTNGLVAARRILERSPEIAILILSMHDEQSLVRQAFAAGTRGYMLKDALDVDLAAAVRRVAAGAIVLDPKMAHAMTLKGTRVQGLSARQLEVLQLICDGRSNPAIAKTLNISVHTAHAIRHRLVNVP